MARRGSNYTAIGRKIKNISKNQSEIARVLGLTQQSVSGKFIGKIAISVADLEKLSAHFNCPIIYFFLPENVNIAQAELIINMLGNFHEGLLAALKDLSSRPNYIQSYVADMASKGMSLYDQGHKDSLGVSSDDDGAGEVQPVPAAVPAG